MGLPEDSANAQFLLILFLHIPFKRLTLSSKCNAKGKKPDSKGYILHDPMGMTFWKRQTIGLGSRCQESSRGGGLTTQGHERIFRGNRLFITKSSFIT